MARLRVKQLEQRLLPSAPYTVTNTSNNSSVIGSLPYEVAQADSDTSGTAVTINFAAGAGQTFATRQTIALGGTVNLSNTTTGESILIAGPAAGLTIAGGGSGSNFSVIAVAANTTATIESLTISNGYLSGGNGAGIANAGTLTVSNCTISGNSATFGGLGDGIFNSGMLTVENSTISDNSAGFGGGIFNFGTLIVDKSTLSGNSASAGGGIENAGTMIMSNSTLSGNTGGNGGGIANFGMLTVENSTLSGNVADDGGGIDNDSTLTVENSTLSGNLGYDDGGGIDNEGSATLNNTIVANSPSGHDLYLEAGFGSAFSGSNDLIQDGSELNSFTNSQQGPALLAPLGNYGGPTQTMALLPGSPAIGAGAAIAGITTDQRGEPIANGSVDIGAFESQGFILTIVSGNNQSTATARAFNPLVVSVTANNPAEPVNGGVVTMTVNPANDGAVVVLSGTTATIHGGQASLIATATGMAGSYSVSASARGASPVVFNLTTSAIQAIWVYPNEEANEVTDPSARQMLVNQCAASGINTIYISVYQSTPNSAGRYMYDDSDMAALIALAHSQGIQVWADYGAPDWPALYGASGSSSFPAKRLAEVVAYNTAEPTAPFDGVMLDVEYNPGYDAASNEPESTFLTQLVPLYQASLALLRPAGIQVGAAISAFWNPNTDPSVTEPVYQQIIGLGLSQVVVLGYRDFAGSSTEGDGIIGLDQDEVNYAVSAHSTTLIVAGLETQNITPSDQTFFSDGNADMNSVMQTVAGYFGSSVAGFAIDAYQNAYLSDQTNWPGGAAVQPTIVVTTASDLVGHAGTSLRDAISQADSDAALGLSDAITFAPYLSGETIVLSQGELELGGAAGSGTATITIDASSLPDGITVSGNNASGVFAVESGANVVLTCITIQNGHAGDSTGSGYDHTDRTSGGAVFNAGTLTVRNSTLSNNTADVGGGIVNDGTLTVDNTILSGNSAAGGGGIQNDNAGTLIVENSTFSGNSASDGGGGILNDGTLIVEDSTLSGNSGDYGGGGIANGGTLTVENSTFSGNSGDNGGGGGIYIGSGNVMVINSTLADNSATYGGGIANNNGGGGIDSLGMLTVEDSTLSGNSAGEGGGIFSGGSATLNNTIVANSPSGDDLYPGTGSTFSGSNDLIGDGSDLGSFTHSLQGNPLLAPLGNYGGPTQTMALLPGSPALDAGSVALAVDANGNALTTDQRGTGFPRTSNGMVDIGAVETNVGTTLEQTIQQVLSPSYPVTVQANTNTDAQNAINAVDGLPASSGGTETVTLNLAAGVSYSDLILSPPAGVTLVINGQGGTTTIVGQSPALTVLSGTVSVSGVTLTTATDAPTILVTGGSLTLGNDTVQETSAYSAPALLISGGTVDLGTPTAPGGNIFNGNGNGVLIQNASPNVVSATGDTFEVNGTALSTPATVVVPTVSVTGGTYAYDGNPHGASGSITGAGGANLGTPTFSYTDANGNSIAVPVKAGTYTVLATYFNSVSDTSATNTATIVINPAKPVITWTNPNPIATFTPLGGAQLDAAASVAGTFVYNPPAGTELAAGTQTLSATFTPADGTDYSSATASVNIVVLAPGASTTTSTSSGSQLFLAGSPTANGKVQITPVGSSNTGSSGVQVAATTTTTYNQAFTAITIFAGAGNVNIQVPATLTIALNISAGGGNDNLQLGGGNNVVTLGSGANDQVQAGNGNNTISLGDGANDQVHVGNGNNSVTLGNGANDQVQATDGKNTINTISLGNGANDQVHVGDGSNTITVGSGNNDQVHVGNGNNVVVVQSLSTTINDQIQAGNGDNLLVGGLGQEHIQAGNGNNILIDGSVAASTAALDQALMDWVQSGNGAASTIESLLGTVNFNNSNANTLNAGNGVDWFWAQYAQDHLNPQRGDTVTT